MRPSSRLLAASTASVLALTGLVALPQNAHAEPLPEGVTTAENPRVPEGAEWTEAYFPSSVESNNGDPVELHADILRPTHLAPDEASPVILAAGPYFAHEGQTGDDGFDHTGPSERFYDLVEGGDLMERGYTFVMVDTRGYGGSTGCIDWLGTGEQADVVSAVDWITDQEWSNGKVGMYGKSYDATTGLAGANLQPEGLEAVVAQEPVWNMYNYLYSNDLPRPNQIYTPDAYNEIAQLSGFEEGYAEDGLDVPADTDRYLANAAYEQGAPECLEKNSMDGYNNTALTDDYWVERDLPSQAKGSTMPLFVTQGFIEPNTKPENMQTYLANHEGPQRGWLGQFEHVRGNDVYEDGSLAMGREGWFEEVMSFYDEYLLDIEPTVDYPNFLLQDSNGKWRAQDAWPEATKDVTVELESGVYNDGGVAQGPPPSNPDAAVGDDSHLSTPNSGNMEEGPGLTGLEDSTARDIAGRSAEMAAEVNYATFSEPVLTDVRLTSTPTIRLETEGERNVMIRLWDIDPDGTTTMFNENVAVLDSDGSTEFDLKGQEWTLDAGDTLMVTIGTVTDGYWWPSPSNADVTVNSAELDLGLQTTADDVSAEGRSNIFLDYYKEAYTLPEPITPTEGTFVLSLADPSLSVSPDSVEPGETVEITGAGNDPGAKVEVTVGDQDPETVTADTDGGWSSEYTVPEDAEPGAVTVTATAPDGTVSTAEFTVESVATPTPTPTGPPSPSEDPSTSPDPTDDGSGDDGSGDDGSGDGQGKGNLADTGAPAMAALLGAGLLAATAGTMMLRRRRG